MRAIYNTNLKRLALLWLPTFFRKPIIQSILRAGIRPIFDIQREFASLREKASYKIKHNGQICYLCAALNDDFDTLLRRIKIVDAPRYEHSIFYPREDKKAVSFIEREKNNPVIFFDRALIGSELIDFIVQVPKEILSDKQTEIQLRSLVNAYKLASKRYILNTI